MICSPPTLDQMSLTLPFASLLDMLLRGGGWVSASVALQKDNLLGSWIALRCRVNGVFRVFVFGVSRVGVS